MSDQIDDDLPPLGEPTPARPRRRRVPDSWQQAPVVALIALVIGLLVGLALGLLAGDGEDGPAKSASGAMTPVDTSPPPTTTTTLATVPTECLETIRSAEQALALLDQGARSLRDLRLADTERAVADMERLRRSFARQASGCLENART